MLLCQEIKGNLLVVIKHPSRCSSLFMCAFLLVRHLDFYLMLCGSLLMDVSPPLMEMFICLSNPRTSFPEKKTYQIQSQANPSFVLICANCPYSSAATCGAEPHIG